MRTNLRTQFDSGATYYQLLELARIVESENFMRNLGMKLNLLATKAKANYCCLSG